MKSNRRKFIKKSTTPAVLSTFGIGANKTWLFQIREYRKTLSNKAVDSQKSSVMEIAFQLSPEPADDKIRFIKQTLRDMEFDGVLIADHISSMVYQRTNSAFTIGYLKAMIERVYA